MPSERRGRTVAIVQARMGSERLPGKTLMPLAGTPMLARVVRRVVRATLLDEVVVATSRSKKDEPIAALCREQEWLCERGSADDVLDRFYEAAKARRATDIVRVTGDCPLLDPEIVDLAVRAFGAETCDYASTTLEPRTYPRGLDVEVLSFEALERAWREDRNPTWREHVTPYIYRHPDRFRLHRVAHSADHSAQRWTVDTPEDYEFVRRVYEHFGDDTFSWTDVLALLEDHPEWLEINRNIRQKVVP